MKKIRYGITFGIALVCAMLFIACDNLTDTLEIQKPVENGYGRVSISFTEKEGKTQQDTLRQMVTPTGARSVLPSIAFDKYVYTFTKVGETTGVVKTPDENGFFIMEVGNYTIAVQAYVGTDETYTLVASGVSPQFSVSSGSNAQVLVPLSRVTTTTEGQFNYNITYPVGADAVITMKKYPEMTDVPLNPVITTSSQAQMREVKIEMYDANSDGWDGNGALIINVNGVQIANNVKVQSGSTNTYTFNVSQNDIVQLYWVAGTYQTENSFIVYYADTPPSPAFTTSNNNSWSGSNALIYKLRGTMDNISGGTLLGSFTVIGSSTNTVQGNGKTQTLQLDAGSYLFTVLVSKDGLYAGLSEAVHINSLLTTVYTKNFSDSDFVTAKIPLSNDYTVSGTGTVIYDGNPKVVSITPKTSASQGEITVYYTGTGATTYEKSTVAPINLGTYIVTFDVTAATGFATAVGLPAGILNIENPTPVIGDYNISGIGTFTYDGTERTVSVTPKANVNVSSGKVTILYNGVATTPVNAGTYSVKLYVEAAPGWNATKDLLDVGNIVINKATGLAVSAPTSSSITGNSITVNAVTEPSNGQTVEYARSTSTTAPTTGYQDSTTFSSLSASTSYYIYARTKENTNYNAGTAARSSAITTLHTLNSVTANGSTSSRTTTLTFTFSGNPGTINASNITLSGDASIANNATISSPTTTTRTLPITPTGTNTIGSVTVTFNATGVETKSITVTIYNPITEGLYAKAPPVLGSDTPINLSSTSGTNIIDQAFNYINSNAGTYTLMLDTDLNIAGHSTAEITNTSATRHLKVTNAKLTIIGIDTERKISVTQGSGYGLFAVGRSGYTGIELTIGNNITLVGTTSYASGNPAIQVQNGAVFTMKDNASLSGNNYSNAMDVNSSTFKIQDNAKITSHGVNGSGISTITMSSSASIVGGITGNSSSNITLIMQDNASVNGGVSVYGSNITMSDNSTITGAVDIYSNSTFNMKNDSSVSNSSGDGVSIGNNSKFTMQNNAKVFNNGDNGVYVSGSGSEFTMSGDSSVFGNKRGVNIYNGGSFTMQDNASIYNNTNTSTGGGVYVYSGYGATTTTFTMKNNTSVYGNTSSNGGGIYVEGYNSSYRSSFTMQDSASVSGNTATNTGTTSGGGGVYVTNYGTFEMKGGLIWGNKATGASSNGGGVYVYNNGTFTMSGGKVYGTDETTTTLRNTTAGSGASLYVNSSGSAKFLSNNSDITTPGTGRDTTVTVGTAPIVNVTVTYNINGGTGTTPTAQTVSAGSSITLNNASGLTKTGYTFIGWSTSSSDSPFEGTLYNAGSSYTPISDMTLYAKWVIVLTAGTWKDGSITTSSGSQWFRFTATATTQYIHVSFNTLTDLYVQVYDSSGTTVGAQTNLYSSTKSISRTLTSGQVYYVKVWPYGSNSGTYRIAFNTSSTAPTQ